MPADLFFSIRKYLEYRWKSKTANQIHPPFVFNLYMEVLYHPYLFYAFEGIEAERRLLLSNQEKLRYTDVGSKKALVETTVSRLAKRSLMPADVGQMLFQLTVWLQPKHIVELGTCLGITTAYLASAAPNSIATFEGIPAIAAQAVSVWKNLSLTNIKSVPGKIEETLPVYLPQTNQPVDLAILDANHRYQPTMQYLEWLRPYLHNESCVVIDDIYWSAEMAQAWATVKSWPEVTVSVDLYRVGILFFRKESQKENFVIRW